MPISQYNVSHKIIAKSFAIAMMIKFQEIAIICFLLEVPYFHATSLPKID